MDNTLKFVVWEYQDYAMFLIELCSVGEGGVSKLVECLFTTHEALGSMPGFAISGCGRARLYQEPTN